MGSAMATRARGIGTGVPGAIRARRLVWLCSSALVAFLASGGTTPAQADACDGRPSPCTIQSGTQTGAVTLGFQADDGDDDTDGDDGRDYTIQNFGSIYILGNDDDPIAVELLSFGGEGDNSTRTDGGHGGDISFLNYGNVSLQGDPDPDDLVAGVFLESRGGDGGGTLSDQGIGTDDGGKGGRGGDVTITNSGVISLFTYTDDAALGIYAVSKGGKGGDQDGGLGGQQGGAGGEARTIAIDNSGSVTIGASVDFASGKNAAWGIAAEADGEKGGDNGGKGGDGGRITITNSGNVEVYWDEAGKTEDGVRGIYARSSGGRGLDADDFDGGKGDDGYQIVVVNSGSVIVNARDEPDGFSAGIFALSQGANGGDGGSGGKDAGNGGDGSRIQIGSADETDGLSSLTLSSGSSVSTSGDGVLGVVAATRGGNGGDGDDGSQDSDGGDGGFGGTLRVTVENGALVETRGEGAFGIVAQSLGGEGGDGGDNNAIVGTSGGGGYGGNGGDVTFTAASGSQIQTNKTDSTAVLVQSIGGFGGTGGDFRSILGGSSGNGGNGGDGGDVSVSSGASILAFGEFSNGLVAQSIAGSGGAGSVTDAAILALGGDGGAGGRAGNVSVTNSGVIGTFDDSAKGLVAQSISGGGGIAGTLSFGKLTVGGSAGSAGNGNDVYVLNEGLVQTNGLGSTAILAQSIGGGGGSASGAFGIGSVGGAGGDGGNGDSVTVLFSNGSVETGDDWSNGVTAQSIGGGGGDGGFALDEGLLIAGVGVGGTGGTAGSGGSVYVGNLDQNSGARLGQANIATSGETSYGVLAQSVGGGGGSGGNAVGVGILSFTNFVIGGRGGSGSHGGEASVNFDQLTLQTTQSNSIGIVAQSIGGGGGSGGAGYGADVDLVFAYSAAVGGDAGGGGNGGAAEVDLHDSVIETDYDYRNPDAFNENSSDSLGVLVQSIGGGGGIGGRSIALALAEVFPGLLPASVSGTEAIGGRGGAGGNGDSATANLSGSTRITTAGTGSHGVLVQSIGGGGGHGGNSRSYPVALGVGGGLFQWALSTSIGGQGGGGGDGGITTVNLRDEAEIVTRGSAASGVVAQSIGGGGGDAGAAGLSASSSAGLGVHLTTRIGVGGSGGDGGDGGQVTVTSERDSTIHTQGNDSFGLIAQSVGGGGGLSQGNSFAAGISLGEAIVEVSGSASVTVGNTGGDGGDGGQVSVTTRSKNSARGIGILTEGHGAIGVLAQSIGGGGGVGGSVAADAEVSGTAFPLESPALLLGLGVGGSGGGGGDGGRVTITHAGQIETHGDFADGILAQSIGGGGGVGGTSRTKSGVFRGTVEIESTIGGTGGDGGDGNSVTAYFDDNNDNSIRTHGYMAHGAVLQSIGGGGGRGGDGSDNPNGVIVVGGIFAGSGGRADHGGDVNVGTDGQSFVNITTQGDDAMGLVAQSIGGGGGLGGQGNAARTSLISNDPFSTLNMGVGGSGGSGGNGGAVTIESGFNLTTSGDRSFGLLAQSIGGGGGYGGTGSDEYLVLGVTIGGSGGAAGNGGAVTIAPQAGSRIVTQGNGAHGIVAQSIGGGGGIAGDSTGGLLVLELDADRFSGSNDGDGGLVSIDYDGSISTSGDDAFGILAQSIGNGGGFGGDDAGSFAGSTGSGGDGDAGDVTIVQSGTIYAEGARSVGIFAQSQGDDDNGTDLNSNGIINITVNGTVVGGSDADQGAGVLVSAGRNNVLTINSGGSVSAASGVAVRYLGDRDTAFGSTLTINNAGTLVGDVLASNQDGALASPAPAAKAVAPAAATIINEGVITGASRYQANLVNRGTLEVGQGTSYESLAIDGNFLQEAGGRLAIDADFASGESDSIDVAGDAELSGRVALRITNPMPNRRVEILTVGGTASQNATFGGSDLFTFDLASTSGGGLSLGVDANFTDSSLGLSERRSRFAQHLQDVWDAGGGDSGELFNELAQMSSGSFQDSLSAFEGEILLAPAAENIWLSEQRLDRSLSCQQYAATSTADYLRQGNCAWASVSGGLFDQGSKDGVQGYGDRVFTYALGVQKEVMPDVFLGLSASYDDSRIRSNDKRLTIDGDVFSVSGAIKYDPGPWLAALAVAGSFGDFDNSRATSFGSLGGTANSSTNVYSFSSRFRGAYSFTQDWFYAQPFADLDILYSHQEGFTESGAGSLNLTVDGFNEVTVLGTPAVEIGAVRPMENGLALRAFARGGVTFSSTGDVSTDARLASAPAGADGFDLVLPGDQVFGRVSAGVELARIGIFGEGNDLAARVQYDGIFSGTTARNSGSLKISLTF